MKLVDLESQIMGEIRREEQLKFHTGIRLGGPAHVLVIPKGIEDLRRTLVWAGKNLVSFRVIGNGSSILVHPDGYQGPVIKLAHVLNHIRVEENLVYVGVGTMMSALLRQLLHYGLSGLEEWYSPNTVGGWLGRMARWDATALDHLVKEMYVMEPDGHITKIIEPSQLYETASESTLSKIVVEVVFQLQSGKNAQMAQLLMQKEREWNFLTQLNLPLAGPAFLNTEKEILEEFSIISGLRKGQAAFLGVGSGFIANLGGVSFEDIESLMREIKLKVFEKTGLHLLDGLNYLETKEVIQW